MNISKKLCTVAALGISLVGLVGCGGGTTTNPSQPSNTRSTQVENLQAKLGPDALALMGTFGFTFPEIAQAHTDSGLANAIAHSCQRIGTDETAAVINNYVSGQFSGGSGNITITPAQAEKIAAYLKTDICPKIS